MGNEKDDVLRSILEIRRKREVPAEPIAEPVPEQPEYESLQDPDEPSPPNNLSRGQALLKALATKNSPTQAQSQAEPEPPPAPPVTAATSVAEAIARAARPQAPLVALIRVCPTSVSGNHEWVYPAERRSSGDIYCRHCGHRKANR
jgi:hypothetical protein